MVSEGGLRVPCILRWPAKLEGKRKSSQPAITMDLTATIMAAAEVKARADRPLDGVDLIPLLNAKAITERTFFWRGTRPGSPDRAVREGRLKFLAYSQFPGLLFDVVADPGERKDLAAGRADVLRRLDGKHRAWEREFAPAKP